MDHLSRPVRLGKLYVFLVILTTASMTPHLLQAQQVDDSQSSALVQLTFPPETELRVLIDYVSQRLGVRFLYDEQVANKRISIKAAEAIPADTLLDVLESALKMKGLAMVDGDVQGWKRIVMAGDLAQIAVHKKDEQIEGMPGATAVTQAFTLVHMSPERVGQVIAPFLTKQGANTITLPDQRMLIVTDYADNLRRIADLIGTIDQAGPERRLEFYEVKHVEATALAQQLSQSLASQASLQEGAGKPVEVSPDPRSNQLLIVGAEKQIAQALQLARALDINLGQRTQVYTFQYISAQRIDRFIQELFDPVTVKRLYRSAVDQDDNLLIVTGTDAIHERIAWLKREMDVETKRPGSAVKFYRIKYADAQELLNTLRAMEQQPSGPSTPDYRRGVSPLGRGGVGSPSSEKTPATPVGFAPGANEPAEPGNPPPTPPAQQDAKSDKVAMNTPRSADDFGQGTIVPGAARVSVDPNTNSIIVIADRAIQEVYADLIVALDRRRPQVMIEAKVVILDTTDDFSFGVELSAARHFGAAKMLQFTSLGLSTVNPVSGSMALIPGRGFNWTLLDPENADAVIKALTSHRRAKVLSSPRILVNDNATGSLASVTEVPFTSVNASNTVATTSFAGFAEAGTTIEVTPRISDEEYLQLDFNISLNSFTGAGGNGVPPPRQTDQVSSSATIPDGYTVIVGGLTRRNESQSREGIPILDSIPVVNWITSIRSSSKSQTTLFVFLRPVILHDDKFRDLKYLSDTSLSRSTEQGNYPVTGPLLIE